MTSAQLLNLARSNHDGTDLTYARVDWEAECRAGQTPLDYWTWVETMHGWSRREPIFPVIAKVRPDGTLKPMVLRMAETGVANVSQA